MGDGSPLVLTWSKQPASKNLLIIGLSQVLPANSEYPK